MESSESAAQVAMKFRLLELLRANGNEMYEGCMYRGVHFNSCDDGWYVFTEEQKKREAGVKHLVRAYQTAIRKAALANRAVGAVDYNTHRFPDRVRPTSSTIQLKADESTHVMDLTTESGIARLKALAVPAPFGDLRTQETKVDDTVRDALRVDDAASIKIGCGKAANTFQSLSFTATDPTTGITAFNTGSSFPELDWSHARINIYEVGGHFSCHVDTPSCGSCIGTLVWALNPGGWEGGQLRVKCSSSQTSSWTGTMLVPDTAKYSTRFHAQGVMFYSDMPHEVMPVTAGVRITLSVPILAVKGGPRSSVCWNKLLESQYLGDPLWDDRIIQAIQDLNAGCAKLGLRCALMLSHGYTATNVTAGMLKGVDVAVVDLVQRAALGAAELNTVIVQIDEETEEYSETIERTVRVFAINPELVTSTVSKFKASSGTPDAGPVAPPTTHKEALFIDLSNCVHPRVGDDTELRHHYQEFIEHTGNESWPHELYGEYVRAALMLPFPEEASGAPPVHAGAGEPHVVAAKSP